MTLTRTAFLTSGFVSFFFFLLVICGLGLPVAASPHRAHGALAHQATAAALSYSTVLRGRASWYGRQHQGHRTSSGERFNRFKYTCAHKTLPFGTRLRVTNSLTGKSVVVRVSDRGPFRHQRILDLSEVAARPLGIVNQGAATIIAQVVPATTPLGPATTPRNLLALRAADPDPRAAFTSYQLAPPADTLTATAALSGPVPEAANPNAQFVVQAGSFSGVPAAQARQARLLTSAPDLALTLTQATAGNQQFNQVVIGQLDSWLAAETVRRRLQIWSVTGMVRQLRAQPIAAATPTMPRS